jgi:hypothetical protein
LLREQKLNLTDLIIDYRMTRALFQCASPASSSLRSVSFSHCERFGDAELAIVLRSLPKLEQLDLSRVTELTAECANTFASEASCATSTLRLLVLAGLSIIDTQWLTVALEHPHSPLRRASAHSSIAWSLEACSRLSDSDVNFVCQIMGSSLIELGTFELYLLSD